MNAVVSLPMEAPYVTHDEFKRVEEMLYAWGDECRQRSEELGLPASSGIARMIEQQRVFEQKVRARRGRNRQRKPAEHRMADGTTAKRCVCGTIYAAAEGHAVCPRCRHDPRPVEREVHGTPTRSFRPIGMTALSATTATIDAIVATAPGWMQKCLRLSYLFVVRDSKAAQQLRMRRETYSEQREASVEYVAERLDQRGNV